MSRAHEPAAVRRGLRRARRARAPTTRSSWTRIGDPGALRDEALRRLEARGVTFGGGEVARFDPMPRILTEPEWSELQAGIGQRVRALEAFAGDVYGEGRVFDAGVRHARGGGVVAALRAAMRGATPRRWVAFAGLDVIRCDDGRFRVIEDQLRMPSGIAYAVAWRETLRELLPVEPPQPDVSLVVRRAGARAAGRGAARASTSRAW